MTDAPPQGAAPAPAAPPALPPASADPKLRLLIPLVVAFAFFLEQLDSTIITTAIPDMARGLGETPLRLNLALTGYILSLAVFIPVSGWIADRFGMRRTFCAAIGIFTFGSAICGLSTDLTMLVLSRVLQGFGGAMMTPVGRLILLRSFARKDMVTAMTYVSIPAVLGPTLGPLAGGLITTIASWRWIFYVNIPFGALGILLAWNFVRDVPTAPPPRFDVPGFLIIALGMVLFQAGVELLGHPMLPWPYVGCVFALSVLVLFAYARYAARRANPALDLTQMRVRSFRVSVITGGLCRVGLNAVPFLLPLMLQIGFGLSPVQSGSLTFVLSLGALVIRPVTAILLRRLGFNRLLIGNAVIAAGALAGFALISPATPHGVILAYVLVFGIVRNTQFNAVQTLTYAEVPRVSLSRATSLGSAVQQLNMGLGVSVSAALLGMLAGPSEKLSVADFHHVFLLLALVPLAALPGFLSLSASDGAQVSGHVRGGRLPIDREARAG
jgi:EmrB/QacA subfamily drug resistance transporter